MRGGPKVSVPSLKVPSPRGWGRVHRRNVGKNTPAPSGASIRTGDPGLHTESAEQAGAAAGQAGAPTSTSSAGPCATRPLGPRPVPHPRPAPSTAAGPAKRALSALPPGGLADPQPWNAAGASLHARAWSSAARLRRPAPRAPLPQASGQNPVPQSAGEATRSPPWRRSVSVRKAPRLGTWSLKESLLYFASQDSSSGSRAVDFSCRIRG